jgi:hypothetical protein
LYYRKEKITDTIEFIPKDYVAPNTGLIQKLQHAFVDVIETLKTTTDILKNIQNSNDIDSNQKTQFDEDVQLSVESTKKIAQHFHQDVEETPKGYTLNEENKETKNSNINQEIQQIESQTNNESQGVLKTIKDEEEPQIIRTNKTTPQIQVVAQKEEKVEANTAPRQGVKDKIPPTNHNANQEYSNQTW